MAIFGSKKQKGEEKEMEKTDSKALGESGNTASQSLDVKDYSSVLLRPRITEKSSYKTEVDNAYVFEIAKDADKKKVSKAILEVYKVKPVKVNIVKNPSKRVFVRGKRGVKSGVKKAYVYLKKGDKIEII